MNKNYSEMNIHEKIFFMKLKLAETDIPKNGKNKFSNFNYHELKDLQTVLFPLYKQYNIDVQTSFIGNKAIVNAINLDDISDVKEIEMPIPEIKDMNKKMNIMQSLGSYTTYLRRYLLLILFDISEECIIDSGEAEKDEEKKKSLPEPNTPSYKKSSKDKNKKNSDEKSDDDKPQFLVGIIRTLKRKGHDVTNGAINAELKRLVKEGAMKEPNAKKIITYVHSHPEVLT